MVDGPTWSTVVRRSKAKAILQEGLRESLSGCQGNPQAGPLKSTCLKEHPSACGHDTGRRSCPQPTVERTLQWPGSHHTV
jgi:hypothetical protein